MPKASLSDQVRELGFKVESEFRGQPIVKDIAGRSLNVTKILDGHLIHVRIAKLAWRGPGKDRGGFHVSAMIRGLWQGLHPKPINGSVAPDEFIRQQLEFYMGVLRKDAKES